MFCHHAPILNGNLWTNSERVQQQFEILEASVELHDLKLSG